MGGKEKREQKSDDMEAAKRSKTGNSTGNSTRNIVGRKIQRKMK